MMVVITSSAAEVRHGHTKHVGSKTDKPRGGLIHRYTFKKYGRKGAIAKANSQHYAITKSQERASDNLDSGAIAVRSSLQDVSVVGSTVPRGPYKPVQDGMLSMSVDCPEQTGRQPTPPIDTVKIFKPGVDTMPSLAEQRDQNGIPYGPASDPRKVQAGVTKIVDRTKRISPIYYGDFGGEGSGNWGHEGRPGEVGGSGAGGGVAPSSMKSSPIDRLAAAKENLAKYSPEALKKSWETAMKAEGTPEFEALKAATLQLGVERRKAEKAVEKLEKAIKQDAEPKPERVAEAVKELEKSHEDAIAKTEESKTGDTKELLSAANNKYEEAHANVVAAVKEVKDLRKQGITSGPAYDKAIERYNKTSKENNKYVKEIKSLNKTIIKEVASKIDTGVVGSVAEEVSKKVESFTETYSKETPLNLQKDEGNYDWQKHYEEYHGTMRNEYRKEHPEDFKISVNEVAEKHIVDAENIGASAVREELSQKYSVNLSKLSDDDVIGIRASLTHNEEVLGKERLDSFVQKIEVKPIGSTANYSYNTKTITVSSLATAKDTKEQHDVGRDGVSWHGAGGRNLMKSNVDHEIGHALLNSTDMNVVRANIKVADTVIQRLGREGASLYVSGYAAQDGNELAAESWSNHLNNGSANKVVEHVAAFIQELK